MTRRNMNWKAVLWAGALGLALVSTGAAAATPGESTAGAEIDDLVVLGKVKAALIGDPITKARQINVEVDRGTIQLNGFVDSPNEKSHAATIAREVEGVVEVQNNLAIGQGSGTVGEVLDDATLATKVKAALVKSSATKAYQIKVETRGGIVQLSGFVDDATAKESAEAVAWSVSGVKDVQNRVSIRSS
jgi:hyperosmotically inducible protein